MNFLVLLLTLVCLNVSAENKIQSAETFDITAGHNHACALTDLGVKCFGNAEKVILNAPAKLNHPSSLEAANRFSCAIVDEGIRCWGEIPNSKMTDLLIPNSKFKNAKLLSLGYEHACAVSASDSVMCWGMNDFNESTPPSDLKNITELSLGMSNSCAIADGKVVCWGISVTGSLDAPQNLINPRHLTSGWWHHCVETDEGIKCWGSPYKKYVLPNDPNIKEFTSGGFFNCALVAEGVKCWDEKGITAIVSGSEGATKVSVGSSIACAVTPLKGVICWKFSDLDKGVYKTMMSYVPSGGISAISKITTGHGSTCVYGDEGKLKCWGANFDHALDVPALIPGVLSALSTGAHKTCAISESILTCWGDTNSDYNTPKGLTNVTMVSSGGNHICAGNYDQIKCWGDNIRGALDVPKELTHFSAISAGNLHACAVADDQVTCWGGEGLIKNVNPPKKMVKPTAICTGGTFSCGISTEGKVQCWGEQMKLSAMSEDVQNAKVQNEVLNVPDDIVGAVEISCGESHGCAIYNGKIKCWGSSAFSPERLAPPATIKNPRMLSAGWNHTCAIGDNGLSCWGSMVGMDMPNYSLEK